MAFYCKHLGLSASRLPLASGGVLCHMQGRTRLLRHWKIASSPHPGGWAIQELFCSFGATTLRHFLYHPTEVSKATERAPEAYISDLLSGVSCMDPCFPRFISPLSWSSWHYHPNELFVFRISVWETLTQTLSPYSYIPLSKPDDVRMHSDPGNLTLPFSHSSTSRCFSSHFNSKLYTTMK